MLADLEYQIGSTMVLFTSKFYKKKKIFSFQSRYANNYTLLSKTLQEDPSCQLCFIMQKLVLDDGVQKVERIFKQGDIPHLNTLRQVCLKQKL